MTRAEALCAIVKQLGEVYDPSWRYSLEWGGDQRPPRIRLRVTFEHGGLVYAESQDILEYDFSERQESDALNVLTLLVRRTIKAIMRRTL